MTKEKLISLVRRRLAGGNITPDLLGKYPNPVIEAYISTVMNSIFFDLFKNNSSLLDMFAKNYEASIDEYSSMNTHYSTLPASIVQLPNMPIDGELGGGSGNFGGANTAQILGCVGLMSDNDVVPT